jgi:hypothetical protein
VLWGGGFDTTNAQTLIQIRKMEASTKSGDVMEGGSEHGRANRTRGIDDSIARRRELHDRTCRISVLNVVPSLSIGALIVYSMPPLLTYIAPFKATGARHVIAPFGPLRP